MILIIEEPRQQIHLTHGHSAGLGIVLANDEEKQKHYTGRLARRAEGRTLLSADRLSGPTRSDFSIFGHLHGHVSVGDILEVGAPREVYAAVRRCARP